jgi:catecholate siderophore receptor
VPQSVIRSQNASTLSDALRNVPGISYAAAEGGTQLNQVFYLRGFPLNQDIYIDGVRDMGEYNRDIFATESVEVLKGPSALIFGRGGSGGLINQTSKIANLLPHSEAALTLGSFNQRRLTADTNFTANDSNAFRIVALAEDSGSYRYPQGVQKTGVAPSMRFGIGTGTEVMVSYYYLKESSVTDYGQPTIPASVTGTGKAGMPPVSARAYYGFQNSDFADYQTNILTARVDHRFNDLVSLRNTFRASNYRRQSESTISQSVVDSTGAPLSTATPISRLLAVRNHDSGRTRDNDDWAYINQTDLTWKFGAGGMKHTLLTGLELASERLHRWNYILDANPALAGTQNPASNTPYLSPDPSTALSYSKTPNLRSVATGDTVALYAQDQMEINRYWKALFGLRWEQFSARANTQNYLSAGVAAGPFARTDNMTSGRAGLIWQPSDAQSYYVSYANSYNPSGELGVYAGTAQTNLTAVTQNLPPEENRNYELGGQWNFLQGLQLRSALFRTEKINQRIANSVTGVLELAGKRRVEGIEFELSGSITPNWDIYSGLAFSDGRIVTSNVNQGNTPLGVSDASGSVWTVYRLGAGWEVGGGVRYNSGFFLTDANNGEVPAYTVVDATVAYVQKKYEVRLNGYNLADKLYYMGGYQNAPNRVIPGQPRAFSVTLRYNFD